MITKRNFILRGSYFFDKHVVSLACIFCDSRAENITRAAKITKTENITRTVNITKTENITNPIASRSCNPNINPN